MDPRLARGKLLSACRPPAGRSVPRRLARALAPRATGPCMPGPARPFSGSWEAARGQSRRGSRARRRGGGGRSPRGRSRRRHPASSGAMWRQRGSSRGGAPEVEGAAHQEGRGVHALWPDVPARRASRGPHGALSAGGLATRGAVHTGCCPRGVLSTRGAVHSRHPGGAGLACYTPGLTAVTERSSVGRGRSERGTVRAARQTPARTSLASRAAGAR
jgi:hypothetical protein